MINARDVVTLKVPFPDISSELALKAHMYICYQRDDGKKQLVKCQTFKFGIIMGKNALRHYVREKPDLHRNPFRQETLIDCDKLFATDKKIDVRLRTVSRPDICVDLFDDVHDELICDGYAHHEINDIDFVLTNRLVT